MEPILAQKKGAEVGRTRRGMASKIMAVADRNGLPIAAGIASGERHKSQLVEATIEGRATKAKPRRLIGDKAYDGDPLNERMSQMGIEIISPHRTKKRPKTQDGRPLRRYRHRWKVERLFAWLSSFRRLVTRWEYKAENFLGFLRLACAVLLLRRL